MTLEERITALMKSGFTHRQAAFLATVLLTSGVCVQRQYCAFAGISHGQVVRDFFAELINRRYATPHRCNKRDAQIFHVHHKALYRAIGEEDNRNRRATSIARAVERLMVLDAVLLHQDITWLATEREKVAYCTDRRQVPLSDLPALTFRSGTSETIRYFPHKLPIGIARGTRDITLLFVATSTTAQSFDRFLADHRRLLQRLFPWRILLVLPRTSASAETPHREVFSDFCAPPLRPALVDELRWYFQARRESELRPMAPTSHDALRLQKARRAFGAPQFFAAYRQWCREGNASLNHLMSPAFHEALQQNTARLDALVLPHTYGWLSNVVDTA
jgi:hypothetical protein